jgi:hypothetical protein
MLSSLLSTGREGKFARVVVSPSTCRSLPYKSIKVLEGKVGDKMASAILSRGGSWTSVLSAPQRSTLYRVALLTTSHDLCTIRCDKLPNRSAADCAPQMYTVRSPKIIGSIYRHNVREAYGIDKQPAYC